MKILYSLIHNGLICNGHHLKCCVDVNCQYNCMYTLEVVSLFLHFVDVTSLTRYGDSDGV